MKKLLLALLLISTPVQAGSTQALKDQVTTIEETLLSLQAQIKDLTGSIADTDTDIYRNESDIIALKGSLKLHKIVAKFLRQDITNNKALLEANLRATTNNIHDLEQIKHDIVQLQAEIAKLLLK